MRNVIVSAGLSMLVAYVAMSAVAVNRGPSSHPISDGIHADFQTRVQAYVALRQELERTTPPIAVSDKWAEIQAAVDALAGKIQHARADAKRGDIFSPHIERWFRLAIAECLEDVDTNELLASLNEEEARDFILVPVVNGRWPQEAPLTMMPPHLLQVLPPLPQQLQYRFMNRALILWDMRVNVIVDFIDGVLP